MSYELVYNKDDIERQLEKRRTKLQTHSIARQLRKISQIARQIRRGSPQGFQGIKEKYIYQYHYVYKVSDGTGSAEVNLIYRKIPLELELPARGDSVQILGFGYKKVMGGGSNKKNVYSFYKIHASGIKKITPQQQMQMNIQAAIQYRKRDKFAGKIEVYEKLQPQIKFRNFQSKEDQIQLRTLVLIYCYYVFEKNPDIQSYIFNAQMIRSSRDGSQFLSQARVTKNCLEAAITKTMQEMVQYGFLSQKNVSEDGNKLPFFVVKKELFRGMERAFEDKIQQVKIEEGIQIGQLTGYVNSHLARHSKNSFILFDWKLSNKILYKLHQLNKIYKTPGKKIYPAIRN